MQVSAGVKGFFGDSVTAVGNNVLVGADGVNSGSGAAYLYTTPFLVSSTNPSSVPNDPTFTATVTGTNVTDVIWHVTGGGTITSAGVYTAPNSVPNPPHATILAVGAGARRPVAARPACRPASPNASCATIWGARSPIISPP